MGLPLASFASGSRDVDKEIRSIGPAIGQARSIGVPPRGARETTRTRSSSSRRLPIIGRATPQLGNADILVLSRFAYMRRRGNEMVLESPRAGALFKICNPKIASAIATLSTPQQIKQLRRQRRLSGGRASRSAGGLPNPFQDRRCSRAAASDRPRVTTTSFFGTFTIFCSTRAARKAGTPIRWAGFIHMRASCRRYRQCGPAGPGRKSICASSRLRIRRRPRRSQSSCMNVTRPAASMISNPITLAELSRFLDNTARVQSRWSSRLDLGDGGPLVAYAVRPYPSAGAQLRARALSGGRQMRGACPRILSLRRRRTRAGADRRAPATSSKRC